MGKVSFTLPWPPSVNHYYRHVGPRVLISREGRDYRAKVMKMLKDKGIKTFEGNVALAGIFTPPDKRRRDLDNVGGKVLLDTLQHAGMFNDDCQVKQIHLEMRSPNPSASKCEITLEDIE